MSQCYIPPLYVVHFKGGLNSGETQDLGSGNGQSRNNKFTLPELKRIVARSKQAELPGAARLTVLTSRFIP
jgi:hypothetical protein